MQLGKEGALKLATIRHFVLDECDKMLEKLGTLILDMVCVWNRQITDPLLWMKDSHASTCSVRHQNVTCAVYGWCPVANRATSCLCIPLTSYASYSADMRSDVQDIFMLTPHHKQVMMFSATLSPEIRPICKKFMSDVRPMAHNQATFGIPVLHQLRSCWLTQSISSLLHQPCIGHMYSVFLGCTALTAV